MPVIRLQLTGQPESLQQKSRVAKAIGICSLNVKLPSSVQVIIIPYGSQDIEKYAKGIK
jgi:hypothetical protein